MVESAFHFCGQPVRTVGDDDGDFVGDDVGCEVGTGVGGAVGWVVCALTIVIVVVACKRRRMDNDRFVKELLGLVCIMIWLLLLLLLLSFRSIFI